MSQQRSETHERYQGKQDSIKQIIDQSNPIETTLSDHHNNGPMKVKKASIQSNLTLSSLTTDNNTNGHKQRNARKIIHCNGPSNNPPPPALPHNQSLVSQEL